MADEKEEKKEGKREGKNEEEKEDQNKGSLVKYIILAAAVVVLGTGGFFGWNQFIKGKTAEDQVESEISETDSQPIIKKKKIIFPLEAFIVNLLDKAGLGKRYLKVTIELEIDSIEERSLLNDSKTQIKDIVLLLLSSRSFKEISTMEGKLELKQVISNRLNQFLGDGVINRVYFTEFVVQ